MKSVVLSLFILASLMAKGQEVFVKGNVELSFDKMHYDMGKVKKGEQRSTQYTFTNTGKEAVEIEIVDGCSCTTLDWTRGTITPGEEGVIDVVFDSTEKEKSETVDIDITLSNTDPDTGNPIFIYLDYAFELVQ